MSVFKDANLKFPIPRTSIKKVEKIIIHHPVANWTVERTHNYFIESKDWNGIAYNYYIQKNLQAFYGRSTASQEYQGAHAGSWNTKSIGVCFEGNYEVDVMSSKMLQLGIDALVELCKKHKLTEQDILPHSAVGNTVCPGKKFPMVSLLEGVAKALKAPPTKGTTMYKVQVGAFLNRKNADRLADELRAKGFPVYVTT